MREQRTLELRGEVRPNMLDDNLRLSGRKCCTPDAAQRGRRTSICECTNAENNTSDDSDSEASLAADESNIETDGMPLLYESSDDSGQETVDDASQGAMILTSHKASTARKASANFAKLSPQRHVQGRVGTATQATRWQRQHGRSHASAQLRGPFSLTGSGNEAVGLRSRKA